MGYGGLIRLKSFTIEAVGAESESRLNSSQLFFWKDMFLLVFCSVGLFDLFDYLVSYFSVFDISVICSFHGRSYFSYMPLHLAQIF